LLLSFIVFLHNVLFSREVSKPLEPYIKTKFRSHLVDCSRDKNLFWERQRHSNQPNVDKTTTAYCSNQLRKWISFNMDIVFIFSKDMATRNTGWSTKYKRYSS
jgi:hypothetical protein